MDSYGYLWISMEIRGMINDSFGGEHFNLDQWAKINKEFLPHNYHLD